MLKPTISLILCLALLTVAACTVQPISPETQTAGAAEETADADAAAPVAVDLAVVKAYALENAAHMQDATAALVEVAQDYYDQVQQARENSPDEDPYARLWTEDQAEIRELVIQARDLWLQASTYY